MTPDQLVEIVLVMIPATAACIVSIFNYKASRKNGLRIEIVSAQVQGTHDMVNDRLTQLLAANRRADLAEGHALGVAAAVQQHNVPPS